MTTQPQIVPLRPSQQDRSALGGVTGKGLGARARVALESAPVDVHAKLRAEPCVSEEFKLNADSAISVLLPTELETLQDFYVETGDDALDVRTSLVSTGNHRAKIIIVNGCAHEVCVTVHWR